MPVLQAALMAGVLFLAGAISTLFWLYVAHEWSTASSTHSLTGIFLIDLAGACAVVLLVWSLWRFLFAKKWQPHSAAAAASSEMPGNEYRDTSLSKAESLNACINSINLGVAMFDCDARLILCNDLYATMYDLSAEDVVPGTALADILQVRHRLLGVPAAPDLYQRDLADSLRRHGSYLAEYACRDGRLIEVKCHSLANGGWVAMHEDISARRRAEAKIERLAHYDLLTGIANRSQFLNHLHREREKLLAGGHSFAVLMIDVDNFKYVNDSLGHAAGDALLKQLVKRLRPALRSADFVARLGGDEFAIIQSPPRSFAPGADPTLVIRESAIILANRIIELLNKPFDLDRHEVIVGASIGIASAPHDGVDPDELLNKADIALYKTKSKGRNGFSIFDTDMAQEADMCRRLKADLRSGLARQEFTLHFQPIVDLATRQPSGLEALLRWNHPTEGTIGPDRFIHLAEEVGMIASLSEWSLHAACAEASRWPSHLKLAVNISPAQFEKTNFLDVIMCCLVEADLPPQRLEIEITEQLLLNNDPSHLAVLHQLKNIGVSIALDDFGTGYSSLKYLTMFPFDKVKIDRSFVAGITERNECAAIVCAVANLGRSLDITVVAEGVEEEVQAQALRAAGISLAQGFLFGRPAPAEELELSGSADRTVGSRLRAGA